MLFAKNAAQRWRQDKRSAVTIIFALSIVPLIYLIGLAVDYTFVSLDRTKVEFAAQAAATHALRIATSTYAYEQSSSYAVSGVTSAQAAADAVTAGNTAGNLWFNAEVGIASRANVTLTNSGSIVTSPPTTPGSTPTFTATVTASLTYPPFFNTLFKASAPWVVPISATAQATFSYAEILMLLDTSNSMLIGADPSDIATMEANSVCQSPSHIDPNNDAGLTTLYYPGNIFSGNPITPNSQYDYTAADNDQINFAGGSNSSDSVPTVFNYTPLNSSDAYTNGTCGGGTGLSASQFESLGSPYTAGQTGIPAMACALACHTTTVKNPSDGFYEDYYGEARRLAAAPNNVKLRLDVMFTAAENVIQDMENSETVSNQLTVGVYQFNADILPIQMGTSSDVLPEATNKLSTALAAFNNYDWRLNHNETAIPAIINKSSTQYNISASPPVEYDNGNTNLPLAMHNLVNGTMPTVPNGTPLGAAGNGATTSAPLKFLFLVTDGLEDDYPPETNSSALNGSGAREEGLMTALNDSSTSGSTCSALKHLGFTIYVLYVDYYPLAHYSYYATGTSVNSFTSAPTAYPGVTSIQQLADTSGYATSTQIEQNVPTAKALAACASSPNDFYSASSSADIQTALSQMLKSALASTIRLTN